MAMLNEVKHVNCMAYNLVRSDNFKKPDANYFYIAVPGDCTNGYS